jgi:hypothetical protein
VGDAMQPRALKKLIRIEMPKSYHRVCLLPCFYVNLPERDNTAPNECGQGGVQAVTRLSRLAFSGDNCGFAINSQKDDAV